MKKCIDFIALMHMHIDGELDDPSELTAHLNECPDCRSLFDEYRLIAQEARALPHAVPDTLHAGIMRALAREKKRRTARRAARIAAPLAACAVIAAAFLMPESPMRLIKDDASGGAMPEATANQAIIAGFGAEAAPTMAGAIAPPGGELIEEVQDAKTQNEPEKNYERVSPFTVLEHECPPVPFGQTFVGYFVAIGGSGLPDFSSVPGEVKPVPETGEAEYLFVENNEEAVEAALTRLYEAGFEIRAELKDAPDADESAEYYLIILK